MAAVVLNTLTPAGNSPNLGVSHHLMVIRLDEQPTYQVLMSVLLMCLLVQILHLGMVRHSTRATCQIPLLGLLAVSNSQPRGPNSDALPAELSRLDRDSMDRGTITAFKV